MVGLSNNFVETTRLGAGATILNHNRKVRDRLLSTLSDSGFNSTVSQQAPGGRLLSGVPVGIIDDFLRDFENHQDSVLSATDPIRRYLSDRRDDELAQWDVLIASLRSSEGIEPLAIGGWEINSISRAIGPDDLRNGILTISGSSARVASRGMEKAGLSDGRALLAEADFRDERKLAPDAKVNFPDRVYRARRERPLFMLFNVNIKDKDVDERDRARLPDAPVVGWGISFPPSARPDQKVEYILNTTKLRELFGEDDSDEDLPDDEE
jgi:hypothetical protein